MMYIINYIKNALFSKIVPALNWAKCWKMLYITPSAVNHLSLKTDGLFRDYTPSSTHYISYISNKNVFSCKKSNIYIRQFSSSSCKNTLCINKPNQSSLILPDYALLNMDKFSYYLTGLIEGDGTIIVPKSKRSEKGRVNYPSIQIAFQLHDLPLALLIMKELNFGSLARKKGVNAYILTINDHAGLLHLIHIINGKMRTPKIHSFYDLIDWYNLKDSGFNIEKKRIKWIESWLYSLVIWFHWSWWAFFYKDYLNIKKQLP